MILCNGNKGDDYFEDDMELRHCVMATTVMTTTVMTPKLIQLLLILQSQYQEQDCKIYEIIKQCRYKCTTYIRNCISNVRNQNPTVLQLTANLYYTFDDVLLASSIQEKIAEWKIAYQIAERQVLERPPVKISVSDIPFVQADYCALAKDSIGNGKELYCFSEEMEAWLDLYMDYDDHDDSEGQNIYDGVVSIIADLHLLAGILTEE